MFESRKPTPATALTLGAARAKLMANGYSPVSALIPDATPAPDYLLSEHPVALRTLASNALAALIVSSPEDAALDQRIRGVLERSGLTRGPVRIGSDGCSLWPLRPTDTLPFEHSALDGAVLLVGNRWLGVGLGLTSRNGSERTIAATHNARNQAVIVSLQGVAGSKERPPEESN